MTARPRCLTGLPLTGLPGCSPERIAGRVLGKPVFVYQRLTAEVRRGQGEPFKRDPAVLAVQVECFPLRHVPDWKLEEVDDGATAGTGCFSKSAGHVQGITRNVDGCCTPARSRRSGPWRRR